MPICLDVSDNGVLNISFDLEVKNDTTVSPTKFTISKNDFLNTYDKVLGTFNDAATVVELKDISATDTNKLKLQVERGNSIWIKIAPQNKSNETSNSNDRVIKMKNLKIELEVGEEL